MNVSYLAFSYFIIFANYGTSVPSFVAIENVNPCELDPIVLLFSLPNVHVDETNCNVTQTKSAFSEKPIIKFPKAKDGATYVILLMDLNSTKCQSNKFYIHWMGTNLPGKDLSQGRTTFVGTQSFDYIPLFSKSNTREHQFVCLAYEQNYNYHYFEYPWRRCFNPNAWAPTSTLREVVYGPTGGISFNINFY